MASLSIYLIVGCGTLMGFGLWLGALTVNKVRGVTTHQLMVLTFAVGLICHIAFSILTPSFHAPDEKPHYNYVKYLAEHHSFPVSTTTVDENYQPPLYYLLLTPIYELMKRLSVGDPLTLRALRFFSVLLWGLTGLLTFRFLKGLDNDDGFVRIFIFSMVALLPTYTFLSSVVNNDNLIVPIGAGMMCLLAGRKPSLKSSALIGILFGVGLLTKPTAIVFAPLIVLALLMKLRRAGARSFLLHLSLSLIPAFLLWAPWAWKTWTTYGSVSGIRGVDPFSWGTAIPVIRGELWEINKTFWAVSGTYNDVYSFYPVGGVLLSSLALAGLLYGLLSKRERLMTLARKDAAIMVAAAFAVLINLIFILVLMFNRGQGRFLFPLLIPVSLLMALGLRMFSSSEAAISRIHVSGFFITYTLSFTCFSLSSMRFSL